MEQYESPWVVLPETIKKMGGIEEKETGFVIVTESTMVIGGHATSAIGR